ncbi:hypothetical protein ACOSP7_014981 [Xanthoceras sorbifolium]|uniref:Uncharacterized protein n=1 Tax=Xanthoceras sorbifolium TaxID=99658 RepID=A0ABQ8GZY1_9ROSI|nr:hypothetical protein JRO89_XSUnG0043300 [Xanthoceras sorbifolium]
MASCKPQSGGNGKLSTAANLANLLPTGTVLAFQALIPSFSNNGSCLPAHKYLTLSAITCFSLICFFSSFSDSFVASNGKVYYGIATLKGLYVFNQEDNHVDDEEKGAGAEEDHLHDNDKFKEYRIRFIDFVHAFSSLLVFLVFATNDSDVQNCFFPHATPNGNALMMNLPLAVGAAVSFLFMLFPTTRRGIGYADSMVPHQEMKSTNLGVKKEEL